MKNFLLGLLAVIVILLIVVGIPWASIAFVAWDWWPGEWHWGARAVGLFWAFLLAFLLIVVAVNADD